MIDLALAGKHSASLIEEKIEVFRSFVAANSQKVSQNPAGFLIRSIEEHFATPKTFETEAKRKAKEEAKQKREDQRAVFRPCYLRQSALSAVTQNFEHGLIRLAAAPPGWLSIRTSVGGFLSACGLRVSGLEWPGATLEQPWPAEDIPAF